MRLRLDTARGQGDVRCGELCAMYVSHKSEAVWGLLSKTTGKPRPSGKYLCLTSVSGAPSQSVATAGDVGGPRRWFCHFNLGGTKTTHTQASRNPGSLIAACGTGGGLKAFAPGAAVACKVLGTKWHIECYNAICQIGRLNGQKLSWPNLESDLQVDWPNKIIRSFTTEDHSPQAGNKYLLGLTHGFPPPG